VRVGELLEVLRSLPGDLLVYLDDSVGGLLRLGSVRRVHLRPHDYTEGELVQVEDTFGDGPVRPVPEAHEAVVLDLGPPLFMPEATLLWPLPGRQEEE
jgi:hypothetical protein